MKSTESVTTLRSPAKGSSRRNLGSAVLAAALLYWTTHAMAIEEPAYTVELSDDIFEIRTYSERIVAQTNVSGSFEDAGDTAFDKLFGYISGDNEAREKIAMTAPVSQNACADGDGTDGSGEVESCWQLSFTMPSDHNIGTLPSPDNSAVELSKLPPGRFAVVRYSGFWSKNNYQSYRQRLESWMSVRDFVPAGGDTWARYNAPFTPWFLRRNEILVPIESS